MSSITSKDVETIVLNSLGPDVQILNYRLQSFSKQKTGGLGSHHSLIIQVKEEFNDENAGIKNYTFFVKTLPDSPVIQDFLLDESTFLEEVHFYKEIQPIMDECYNGDQWSPRCYLAKSDVIVLEDLRAQGYSVHEDPVLNEQFLRSALSSLARFHASSILTEKQLGKSLKQVYPNAFEEKIYTNNNKFGRCTLMGFETAAMMCEKFGLDVNLVPKIYDRVKELIIAEKGRCNVVCHGDLWKNNLLFDNSNPPKCLLVDYQFLRYASPTVDVSMLLYLHTTLEYRKKSEQEMFDHYYYCLRDALLRNDSEFKVPSYENIFEDYKKRRLVGMMFAVLYLPGTYLKTDDLVKMMNDPEVLKRWLLQNRKEVTQLNMEENPVYEKKMKNIVTELLEEAGRSISHTID